MQTRLEILLAEQDESLVQQLSEELAPFAASVHVVDSMASALHLVRQKKLDAAFVSLDHTGLDAVQLVTELRSSTSNATVPVVAVVPHQRLGMLEEATRAGASHVLTKPIVWSQVRQLLLSIHWRMVDERRHYRRASVAFPVLCVAEGTYRMGHSRNVSARGMLLVLDTLVPAGYEVVVAFPFSEMTPAAFVLQARVVRHLAIADDAEHPMGMAVEFVRIEADQAERLRTWVDMFVYFDEPGGSGSSEKA